MWVSFLIDEERLRPDLCLDEILFKKKKVKIHHSILLRMQIKSYITEEND